MSHQAQHSSKEWQTLQFAPLWVFSAVAGADEEISKTEMGALAKELAEAPLFKDSLARELLMSVGSDLDHVMRDYVADSRDVVGGLRQVAKILKRRDRDHAEAFTGAMMLIGQNIAEASGDQHNPGKVALALVSMALRDAS